MFSCQNYINKTNQFLVIKIDVKSFNVLYIRVTMNVNLDLTYLEYR